MTLFLGEPILFALIDIIDDTHIVATPEVSFGSTASLVLNNDQFCVSHFDAEKMCTKYRVVVAGR